MKKQVTVKQSKPVDGWRNRIVGEDVCDPGQLLANPFNWRIHPHEQELALRGILDEVGWVQRVIVNKRTGHVVDGHLRVATAISKGETAVPVLYVDLSEDEEKKVLLTIDPVGAMAVMDADKFKELLAEVEFASEDAKKSIEAAGDGAGMFTVDETGAPALKDGDRAPFRQCTFTLHDEQFEEVEAAMRAAKSQGHGESAVNENSNGNALAWICQAFNRSVANG